MAINLTKQAFSSIELFAGAGGLALGLEQAGFHAVLLNEQDKHACATLQNNRPHWPILMQDIAQVDFSPYSGQVDLLSGGFPCQAFSYAGQGKGFLDTRGTLFFQFARAIQEVQPKVILGENVKGLLRHDAGKTLATIYHTLQDLGYCLLAPKVLNAVNYRVAQKRERLFILGLRRDLAQSLSYDLDFDAFAQSFESFGDAFAWPRPYHRPMVLADALKKGPLYATDVPASPGQSYAEAKKAVLDLVPAGGCWRDLPDEVARDYMKKSYFLGGGKTGMARRLAWHEPSLTLTTSPAQNQTERCHPDATRPLTVREYARIQSFPDEWAFAGPINQQYKQIGNAVPVNLAKAVGCAVARLLKYLTNELSH